ncbi:uncharacterized protein nccrp1 isoform X1 [Xenopus tropicalis]|uniref:F-box only protein 50 n=1 Tax=Xenopus tropicalis TaxID=8364 RepID=A0A6I8S6A0_XENTR|nr:uncharacterized protein nccrp1 isoform X1 [Xenopus tropicalis]
MSTCKAKEEGAEGKQPGVPQKSGSSDGSARRSNAGRPVKKNVGDIGVSERKESTDTELSERPSAGSTDTKQGGERQGARGWDQGNVEESHGRGIEDQRSSEAAEQEKDGNSVVGQYTEGGGKEKKDTETPREQEKPKEKNPEVTGGKEEKHKVVAKEEVVKLKETGKKVKQIGTAKEQVKQKETAGEEVRHKETSGGVRERAGEKVPQKQPSKVGVEPLETVGEGVKQEVTAGEKVKFKKTTGKEIEGTIGNVAKYQDTFGKEVKLKETPGKEIIGKETWEELKHKEATEEGVRQKETAGERVKQKETADKSDTFQEISRKEEKQIDTSVEEVEHKKTAGEKVKQKETAKEEVKQKETVAKSVKFKEIGGKEETQKETAEEGVKQKETAGEKVKLKETVKEEVKQKALREKVEFKETAVQEVRHTEIVGEEVKQNVTPGVKETQTSSKGVKYQDTIGEEVKHREIPGKGVAQKDLAGGIEGRHKGIIERGHEKQQEAAGGQTKQKERIGRQGIQKGMDGEELNKKVTSEEWKKCKEPPGTELPELGKEVAGDSTKETTTPQQMQKEIAGEQIKDGGTLVEKKQQSETSALQEQHKNTAQQNTESVPLVHKEPETAQEWLELCDREWGLRSRQISMPDSASWKEIYKHRPFSRNFLKSSNPEGLSTSLMPPQEPCEPPPQKQPLETLGNFSGWKISTEEIPVDRTKVPPGVVVCYLPVYSWCVKEQMVDLLAEGLWPELLDNYQPHIYVLDWYEDSKLHKNVYELHVKLLADDKKTVIAQHDLTPENDMSGDPQGWNTVSHIFKAYGSGVRYVHFLHKSKDLSVLGFHRTRVTDSSLFVNLHD